MRSQLHDAMRAFQETMTANLNALLAARSVVEKVLRNIGDSLARSAAGFTYGAHGQGALRRADAAG